MTRWTIKWTETAMRDLSRLDRTAARRILQKLESSTTDPDRFFARLTGSAEHKLRVGDFRLLALLLHGEKTIIVERVDRRSRVYQQLR